MDYTLDLTQNPVVISGILYHCIEQEFDINAGSFYPYFCKLQNGELFFYEKDGPENKNQDDPINLVNTIDLDGWVVSYPNLFYFILTPTSPGYSQVILKQEDPEEYDKWAVAFYDHIDFMNQLSGRKYDISALEIAVNEGNSVLPEPNTEDKPDYFDVRGIRMHVDSHNTSSLMTTNESDNSVGIDIIESSGLTNHSASILNDKMTLDELNSMMIKLFEEAEKTGIMDVVQMDDLLVYMDKHPDFKEQRAKEKERWHKMIDSYAAECLHTMRGYIPPHIFSSTYRSLVEHDHIPSDLARRLTSKQCLWLLRISTHDIGRIHKADLLHRFNPQAQGLDLVELAAIYAVLPEKFPFDEDKSKELWRLSIEELLKSMMKDYEEGIISNNRLRNPAYNNVEPMFSPQEVYNCMHVSNNLKSHRGSLSGGQLASIRASVIGHLSSRSISPRA
jgi:hypothetical protein